LHNEQLMTIGLSTDCNDEYVMNRKSLQIPLQMSHGVGGRFVSDQEILISTSNFQRSTRTTGGRSRIGRYNLLDVIHMVWFTGVRR